MDGGWRSRGPVEDLVACVGAMILVFLHSIGGC